MTRGIKSERPHPGRLNTISLSLGAALAVMAAADARAVGCTTANIGANITTSVAACFTWTGGNFTVSNSGTVTAPASTAAITANTASGTLTNQGTINGSPSSIRVSIDAGQAVTLIDNSGSLLGGLGVLNAGSVGTLNNQLTGLMIPSSVGHALNNTSSGTIGLLSNAGTISSTQTNLMNTGTIGAIINTGVIISTGHSGIDNDTGGTIGTLTNSGTISGATGLFNRGTIGNLSNSGKISAANSGIQNFATISSLSNSGTISGGKGLYSKGNIGTLNNTGLITGTAAAIYLDRVVSGTIVTAVSTLTNFTNTGTVAGSIYNAGNALTISGGTGSTFGTLTGLAGAVGAITSTNDLTFGSGNQLLNDNITVGAGAGTVTNTGVLQVNNPLTIGGNYNQAAGASLLIGVSGAATQTGNILDTGYGRLRVNGNAVIASGSTITLKSQGYAFAQGQRFVVIAANGGATNYNAASLLYSAGGIAVSASVQADSSNAAYSDLVLTLGSGNSNRPVNSATTGDAISSLGGLFKYGGTDAALLNVFNAAAALGSTAAANKAGAQLSPAAISSATSKAVDASTQAVSNVVGSHLDGLRLASAGDSGVSTGERSAEIGLWGQVFGGGASQDQRDNVSGYHSNYRGVLIGGDGLVSDALRAGALFSASKTNLAGDGDNTGSSASVNSYGVTAYGTYTGSPWFINALAGALRQEYSSVRNISYTGFAGTANASLRGSQFIAAVQAGYPLNLDAWMPDTTLTPLAGLSYSTVRQNGYTESGGNGAALKVNATTINSLKSELGARLERAFDTSYGKLLPSVQLGWRHEYRDKAAQAGASFVADSTGATAFTTQGASPVANVGVLNLSLTLLRSGNLSLSGKYTLETGGGYTAQTGSVQVRWQY